MTTLLGGCSQGQAPRATLRVNLRLTAYERSIFQRTIIPAFEATHAARVEFAGGTGDETIGALRAGQTPVDLLAVDTEILGLLIAEGVTADLSAEEAQLRQEVIPSTIAAGKQQGRLYALPYRPTTWVTFYNSVLLEKAGVEPPQHWDDFLNASRRLRAADGSGQAALQGALTATLGGPASQTLVELLWAFGGDPLQPTGSEALAAGEFLAQLAPTLAPGSRDAKFDTLTRDLATDRVAIGPNWPVVATDLIQRGGKEAIAATPTLSGPQGQARLLSGQLLIIPKNAAQPDLARAFAAHLRTSGSQTTVARELAWFPLREDAYQAAPEWQQPIATVALAALREARALPPIAQRERFEVALGEAFRQIAFEQVPPARALASAAEQLRGID